MNRMVFLLPMLTVLNAWAVEGDLPPKSYKWGGHPTFDLGKPELTDSDKRFTWRMWFICKGTRSEGEHGVILENRKLIHGTKIGETRMVNGKAYDWWGPWDEEDTFVQQVRLAAKGRCDVGRRPQGRQGQGGSREKGGRVRLSTFLPS